MLRYIRESKSAPFCLVFDNVDRANEPYQKFIYSLAHALTKDALCCCVVTLRDSFYEWARRDGHLDTRNDHIFEVRPPNLHSVFSRRIKYSRSLLEDASSRIRTRLGEREAERLGEYLEVLNDILLDPHVDACRVIEALSSGNVRQAFDYLMRYATSAHVDPSEFIMKFNRAVERHIRPQYPEHLVLRPIALGSRYRFHDDNKYLANVFAAPRASRGSHFLRLRVLAYLKHRFEADGMASRGICLVTDIAIALASCGHARQQTVVAVEDLVSHRMVDQVSHFGSRLSVDDQVRISAGGNLYLTELIFDDAYLFYMSHDTVIYDREAHRNLCRTLQNVEKRRSSRRDAVHDFLRYLKHEAAKERSVIGAPNASRAGWDRWFVFEIGSRVIGGDEWQGWIDDDVAETPSSLPPARRSSSPNQLTIEQVVPRTELDAKSAIASARSALPNLTPESSVNGSRQFARVLWGLALAQRAGLGPQSASQIARLVALHGLVPVETTNVARFLRTGTRLWATNVIETGRARYALSSVGAALFATSFDVPD